MTITAQTVLKAETREVTSKVLDGEAVIIHISKGLYYSMDGAGGLFWSLLQDGCSPSQGAAVLVQHYEVPRDQAERDLVVLGGQLMEEELVRVAAEPATPQAPSPPPQRNAYTAPRLNIYRDMQDLLALDPPMPSLPELNEP